MFERFRRPANAETPPPAPAGDDRAPPAPPAAAAFVAPPSPAPAEAARRADERGERMLALKVEMHRRLLEQLNLPAIDKVSPAALRQEIAVIVAEQLSLDGVAMREADRETLVAELVDEVTGLGPLEPLLKDDTVSDILVNTHRQVFVEREGVLSLTSVRFKDEQHLMRMIEKITRQAGRRVDEGQPWVDARLPDGSRVHALIPPCAVDGPLVSIRKFSRSPLSMARLVENGTLSLDMARYLNAAVAARLNVVISGGTGSGKTTTLNALSSFIGDAERLVTIEDTAELRLQQTHVGRMEARPANAEGQGEVTLRDLLRNALRMRPDRIIVGEVRGGEVVDMLQAMNTGHEGSMTTIHANGPRDALSRLENMVMMAGVGAPLLALRQQIGSAVHVIVQIQRMSDGGRRVVSIQEVVGLEGQTISLQEMFRFDRAGMAPDGRVAGAFATAELRSHFQERFEAWGVERPRARAGAA